MTNEGEMPERRAFQLSNIGTPVLVGHGDTREEIREVVSDLRMMIDGYDALPAASKNGNAIESLARHCSVFLRKMALGDERNSRLLSDDICKEAGLSLGRIRKVPPERETLAPIDVKLTKSRTHLTLRHPENNDLLGDETFFAEPWHFRIDVEWPLPGMVDWPKPTDSRKLWSLGTGRAVYLSHHPKPESTEGGRGVSVLEWQGGAPALLG